MKRGTKSIWEKREKTPLEIPAQASPPDHSVLCDSLCSGLRFRLLNILDEGVREAFLY